MNKIRIRPIVEEDLPRVYQLIRENTEQVEENAYTAEQKAIWIAENSTERLRQKLKEAMLFCWVEDGVIAGVGGLKGSEVMSMYIDYRQRGKGIGRQLLAHIEAYAREQRLSSLTLTATRSAKLFYERNGFIAQDREWVEVNGVGFDETRMTKDLG